MRNIQAGTEICVNLRGIVAAPVCGKNFREPKPNEMKLHSLPEFVRYFVRKDRCWVSLHDHILKEEIVDFVAQVGRVDDVAPGRRRRGGVVVGQ